MSTFTPIPLITEFTPPPTCTSLTSAGTLQYYHEYNPSETTGAWTSCYPSGFTHASSSGFLTDSYFSPGVCPSGFTMCDSECISEYGAYWGLASSSETGGRCCLSNWSTVPYAGICVTTTSSTTITALGVEVRWQASDLYLYDPSSPGMAKQVSTTVTPTAASTETIIATATISASQIGSSGIRGLGTGAEVGLGVGLATLVLIVLASMMAFLFIRKRRTLDNGLELAPSLAGNGHNGVFELGATYQPKSRAIEIDSQPLPELS